VLYNILIEFIVIIKLVTLIMCLNSMSSKDRIGKSVAFPIQNGLRKGDVLMLLLFICALEYIIKVQEIRKKWN